MTIGDDDDDIFKSGAGVKIIVTIVIIVTATGSPKSRKTFWGEEAQRNERALAPCAGASDMELAPRQAQAQLDAVVPKVEAVEELARRYSDDVDKVLPEAGALETARSYREKKAKPLYKKIIGVLRALYNKYLDLINSFNRLRGDYDRLQQRYVSLDASFDRLTEENKGLKQVAADYDTLCRGYGADRVEEQVRAIREQEAERKQQRRVLRQRQRQPVL